MYCYTIPYNSTILPVHQMYCTAMDRDATCFFPGILLSAARGAPPAACVTCMLNRLSQGRLLSSVSRLMWYSMVGGLLQTLMVGYKQL